MIPCSTITAMHKCVQVRERVFIFNENGAHKIFVDYKSFITLKINIFRTLSAAIIYFLIKVHFNFSDAEHQIQCVRVCLCVVAVVVVGL